VGRIVSDSFVGYVFRHDKLGPKAKPIIIPDDEDEDESSSEEDDDDVVKILEDVSSTPAPPSSSQIVTRGRAKQVKPESTIYVNPPARSQAARSVRVPEVVLPPRRPRVEDTGPSTPTPRSKGKGKAKAKPKASISSSVKEEEPDLPAPTPTTLQTIPPVMLEGISKELALQPLVSFSFLSQSPFLTSFLSFQVPVQCTVCLVTNKTCRFTKWGARCTACDTGHRGGCNFKMSPAERAAHTEVLSSFTRNSRRGKY
jgi:hypothetical protein